MRTLSSPIFWIGVFQSPLLFCLLNRATRDVGQFEIDPRKFVIAVVGGSTILALPLWLLGELPVHYGSAPASKAWFFGLLLGAIPTAFVHWMSRARAGSMRMAPPGKCPYCGRFPGFMKVVLTPPARPFQCGNCGKAVTLDAARAVSAFALLYVPLAVYLVGWGAPEHLPSWAPWAYGLLPLLPYPFLARILPAEEEFG